MEQETQQALMSLVGLSLVAAGRLPSIEWLEFEAATSQAEQNDKCVLHLECMWRITSDVKILVAWTDRYLSVDGEEADVEIIGEGNLCDTLMHDLILHESSQTLTVTEVLTDQFGGFKLLLSGDLTLEVFPDISWPSEYWRLFKPGQRESHFAMKSNGVITKGKLWGG